MQGYPAYIISHHFPCLTAYASPALRTRGKTSEGQIEKSSFASPILRTAGATCSKLSFFFPYLTYKLSPYLRTKQRNIYDGYAPYGKPGIYVPFPEGFDISAGAARNYIVLYSRPEAAIFGFRPKAGKIFAAEGREKHIFQRSKAAKN